MMIINWILQESKTSIILTDPASLLSKFSQKGIFAWIIFLGHYVFRQQGRAYSDNDVYMWLTLRRGVKRRHESFCVIRSIRSVWDRARLGGYARFMAAMHGSGLKQRWYPAPSRRTQTITPGSRASRPTRSTRYRIHDIVPLVLTFAVW